MYQYVSSGNLYLKPLPRPGSKIHYLILNLGNEYPFFCYDCTNATNFGLYLLEMGKTQNFEFMFGLGSLMIRVRFCSGCIIIIIIIINVLIKVTLNEIRCRGTLQSQW